MDADQILVMDHGRIVERGTHRELLTAAGAYAHMWDLQQHERAAGHVFDPTSVAAPAGL
jgi:ATP-binding cassette subfamily B protein